MNKELLIVHTFMGMMVFYGCFCHLVHTDHQTSPYLRATLVLLSMGAIMSALAPFLWHNEPEWYDYGALTMVLIRQFVHCRLHSCSIHFLLKRKNVS